MNQPISQRLLASSLIFGCLATTYPGAAQIIPDNTLPVNSRVSPGCSICTIKGGTVRGGNLFHSFREFSVPTGGEAFFKNDSAIESIFTRVTGNSVSNINGLIRTLGNANLFLINPNGITFGKNARLDVGGSFIGSNANSIIFSDQNFFSATKPQDSPLLSINVPLGLQYGVNSAAIKVQQANLAVKPARTLALVGGKISLEGSKLSAPGGNVELGSLSGAGTVNLNGLESLSFPVEVERGDISLINQSLIDVMASGGGNISINARNLEMANSHLQAGIGKQQGKPGAVAGDIKINVTGNTSLSQSSTIIDELQEKSVGSGGNITLETGNLILQDSQISVKTSSLGNAGNLKVKATQLDITSSPRPFRPPTQGVNQSEPETPTPDVGLFSFVFQQATGNGGNVSVEAKDITLDGKSLIASDTSGAGNGGIVTVETERLRVGGSAKVSASAGGSGNAAQLKVRATKSIELNNSPSDDSSAGLSTVVGPGGTGNAGNMTVETRHLSLLNGAMISADTFGDGNGGDITIRATEQVEITGVSNSNRRLPGGIFAAVRGGRGNGGNLLIETGRLILQDGVIDIGTEGAGNGGNITVRATESVELNRSINGSLSRILAQANAKATGRGGDIFIQTSRLSVSNGNQISAATFGVGEGGNLFVRATDFIELAGTTEADHTSFGPQPLILDSSGTRFPSGLFASSPGFGNAGNLTVETKQLTVRERAQISVSSQKQGAAGSLRILADNIRLDNGTLSAETVEGNQANIDLKAADIQLRRGSRITTNAIEDATGGNISIDTDTLVALEDSDITANAQASFGGRVVINAQGILGTEFREILTLLSDITATSALGSEFNGVVDINLLAVNPSSGLIELPATLVEASNQITARCAAQKGNSFVVTGRGGLPQSPENPFTGTTPLVDLVELVSSPENQKVLGAATSNTNNTNQEIVEAQGWVVDAEGKVTLVAQVPEVTPNSSALPQANCQSF